MRLLRAQHDLSTQEGRVAYAKDCAKIVSRLEPVDREVHLQELMVQTGFSRDVLLAQMALQPADGQPASQHGGAPSVPSSTAAAPVPRPIRRRAVDEHQRPQEVIISLLASGRIPTDIASEEDFDDPVLKRLYQQLADGADPASLVEREATEQDRARVTELLMEPAVSGETDEMLRMARDCLQRIRGEKMDARLKEIQSTIGQMSPEQKTAAMEEYRRLTQMKKQAVPS